MTKPRSEKQQLNDAQLARVCDVMGWDVNLRAARAAKLLADLCKSQYAELMGLDREAVLTELERRFGRGDRAADWNHYDHDFRGRRGEWPTQTEVTDAWGRWARGIAVAPPPTGAGALLAYARTLRGDDGNHSGSD